jgi:hypothetical protein
LKWLPSAFRSVCIVFSITPSYSFRVTLLCCSFVIFVEKKFSTVLEMFSLLTATIHTHREREFPDGREYSFQFQSLLSQHPGWVRPNDQLCPQNTCGHGIDGQVGGRIKLFIYRCSITLFSIFSRKAARSPSANNRLSLFNLCKFKPGRHYSCPLLLRTWLPEYVKSNA